MHISNNTYPSLSLPFLIVLVALVGLTCCQDTPLNPDGGNGTHDIYADAKGSDAADTTGRDTPNTTASDTTEAIGDVRTDTSGTDGGSDEPTDGSESGVHGDGDDGEQLDSANEDDGGRVVIIHASEWTQGQINDHAMPGDTLLFEPGEHGPVDIDDFMSTASNPLVLKSLDENNPATIRWDSDGDQGIAIRRSSYVVVDNLIVNGAMEGILTEGSDHIIIRNNEVHQTGITGIPISRSSKHIDIIGNKIYDTGQTQPKYGEGIYTGSGSYSGTNTFPDNAEYIWIENNDISNCGAAEGINIKAETFYATVRNNYVHDIVPGTDSQVNSAAIAVETSSYSLDNDYRLDERREVWVEDNTIENVFLGLKAYGIEAFGTGVYLLNNHINNTEEEAISLNGWKNLGLPIYMSGNTYGALPGGQIRISDGLDIRETDPGDNPYQPQDWYEATSSTP